MAGKRQIAYRRFANIPAEGDRLLLNTRWRDGRGFGICGKGAAAGLTVSV
jgi:hypothetical protein